MTNLLVLDSKFLIQNDLDGSLGLTLKTWQCWSYEPAKTDEACAAILMLAIGTSFCQQISGDLHLDLFP